MDLRHGSHLCDRDVVKCAERADHRTTEEEAGEIDVAGQEGEEQVLLGAEAGDASEIEEDPREHQGQEQRTQRAGQCHRRWGRRRA